MNDEIKKAISESAAQKMGMIIPFLGLFTEDELDNMRELVGHLRDKIGQNEALGYLLNPAKAETLDAKMKAELERAEAFINVIEVFQKPMPDSSQGARDREFENIFGGLM